MNKTDQFINEGLKEIDREVQLEYDIDKRAAYVASLLEKNPKVKIEYNNDVYDVAMRTAKNTHGQRVIMLMAASHKKMRQAKLMCKLYTPAIYSGEYNEEFTYEENINTIVKTFLGHVTGNFRVETLEDEGAVTIVKEREKR